MVIMFWLLVTGICTGNLIEYGFYKDDYQKKFNLCLKILIISTILVFILTPIEFLFYESYK